MVEKLKKSLVRSAVGGMVLTDLPEACLRHDLLIALLIYYIND